MIEQERNIFFTEPADETQKGERLDRFLARALAEVDLSRSRVQKLIKDGFVTLDDQEVADCSFKVSVGDVYQLELPPAVEADPIPENIALDIVYEDDDLIVVNKPAGMTVHPAAGAYSGTLVNALLYHCADHLSGVGGVKRPGIVHRIDKETSGLLVVAKNDLAHHGLSEQFFDHSIERTYFAFVYGVPNPLSGRIEGRIARSKFDRKKMALVETGGKTAVTHYETEKLFGRAASLVKCRLETGRTHQIRVHLSSIGCHLIGDKVYTQSRKTTIPLSGHVKTYVNTFPRQALHAATLGFIHPRTGEKLFFETDLPEDLKELAETLSKSCII